MAKWARMINNCAVEVTEIDPDGRFHASIVWSPVPDEVTPNSTVDENGNWTIVDWTVAPFVNASADSISA